jgi:serine/threonine protein kinase
MRSQVEKIFHDVADLSAAERDQYFAGQDVGAETRREVEALLSFDAESSGALARDIGGAAEHALSQFEAEGARCGRYQLGSALGRGGMGTVYRATRVDGEVTHEVAVKLLRPGADDPQLHARFLAERQILANLSHPYIARLLDAGHREDGQPYLVMEYVPGRTIDAYCNELGIRRTVMLFLKVCDAVAYLHRNLVVHRDLKPANILVSEDGEPKLLDFGIAKLLEWGSDSTVTSMRMLTPDYASPEQITGGSITTVSDIYSLGAVLYRLLTGRPPHRFQGESAMSMALEVTTREIPPPSRLAPELKGDLEVVMMKALRTEPQERYSSVDALAYDLRACLDFRPVQARSGNVWYRGRRWLRRYWATTAAAAVVIASLSTGLYIANRQRAIAEQRFSQLRQLSKHMLDLDRSIRSLPGSVDARQRLVSATLQYLEGLYAESHGNLDLMQEVSDGYWRLARIQGVNAEPNLGDTQKAEQSLKKADRLMEGVLQARPRDAGVLFRSAVIATDRVIQADTEGRREDEQVHARKAIERLNAFLRFRDPAHPVKLEGLMRDGNPQQAEVVGAATLFLNVAISYVNIHSYEEGERCARRAVELLHGVGSAADITGQALSVVANALRYQGNLEGALSAIRESRELLKTASFANETQRLYGTYAVLMREGRLLGEVDGINLGRSAEAASVLQQALDIADSFARKDPTDASSRARAATAVRELGAVLIDRDPRRAVAVYGLGIRRLQEMHNNVKNRRDLARLFANSSFALRRLHRNAEAKARIDESFAILREVKDYPSDRIPLGSSAYAAVWALAEYECGLGHPGRALDMYEDLLKRALAAGPQVQESLADANMLSDLYATMAGLARQTRREDRASALKLQRLSLWRGWAARLPNNKYIQGQLNEAGRRNEAHSAEASN